MITKTFNQNVATFLAFALIPLSGFATDIYIPSLPTMVKDFHTTDTAIQLTLSMFLISYGVTQLFIGALLDSFGRYKIELTGLLVFGISSLIIALSQQLWLIYAMRIVQGVTTAAIVVAKRAYFVDLFEGKKLQNYLSMFSIIWSVGPIIAPFIGGYFQVHWGWKANFYFLAGFAFLILLLEIIFSKETIKKKTVFQLQSILKVYGEMLTTSSFTIGMALLGFAYSMVMVYSMTGAFIIEKHLHFSPVVSGYSSLFLGFAWMVGSFIGKATINLDFITRLKRNFILQIIFILGMLISSRYYSNLYTMLFFAFIIQASAGYVFNNFFTYCLGRFPKNAGIAGGLTGGVTYVIVSFCSYTIVNIIPAKDEYNLSLSYLVLCILSLIGFYINMKKSK